MVTLTHKDVMPKWAYEWWVKRGFPEMSTWAIREEAFNVSQKELRGLGYWAKYDAQGRP